MAVIPQPAPFLHNSAIVTGSPSTDLTWQYTGGVQEINGKWCAIAEAVYTYQYDPTAHTKPQAEIKENKMTKFECKHFVDKGWCGKKGTWCPNYTKEMNCERTKQMVEKMEYYARTDERVCKNCARVYRSKIRDLETAEPGEMVYKHLCMRQMEYTGTFDTCNKFEMLPDGKMPLQSDDDDDEFTCEIKGEEPETLQTPSERIATLEKQMKEINESLLTSHSLIMQELQIRLPEIAAQIAALQDEIKKLNAENS